MELKDPVILDALANSQDSGKLTFTDSEVDVNIVQSQLSSQQVPVHFTVFCFITLT